MSHVITHPQSTKDQYLSEQAQQQESHARPERPIEDLKMDRRERPEVFPVKSIVLLVMMAVVLFLSWATEGLFMTELLTVAGIFGLIAIVHWMGHSGKPTRP